MAGCDIIPCAGDREARSYIKAFIRGAIPRLGRTNAARKSQGSYSYNLPPAPHGYRWLNKAVAYPTALFQSPWMGRPPKGHVRLTWTGGGGRCKQTKAGTRRSHRHEPIKSLAPYTTAGDDWTFRDISTQKYTHGIHLYPARMHPEIARRIILKHGDSNGIVLDPFMGSGGVLLESVLCGRDAIGLDINPLAVLISKVKTTVYTKNKIASISKTLCRILQNSNRSLSRGGGGRRTGNPITQCGRAPK